MGNDGGSIPRRHELVKNAARAPTSSELKAAVLESLGHAWAHCALSGDSLDKEAVVSDGKGRLYNYESVLKGLMPSDEPTPDITPAALGIRSLRDVAKIKFSINGDKWVCPISMKEMGPATKAVYLIPCGHAFAEISITEIKEQVCPECTEPYTEENVITLLPTTQKEIQRLESRLEGLKAKGLTHTLKKDKSEKKKKRKGDEAGTDDIAAASETVKKAKKDTDARLTGINNPMTASLTAKVMAEQEERNKQRKLAALRSEKAR